MSNKIDRRVLRTRQLLRNALLTLIQERDFDSLTVQDITERAAAERAIRASEQKFSTIFNAVPDAIALSRIADLSIELAEKVVEKNLDRATQIQLIENYINQVGSK